MEKKSVLMMECCWLCWCWWCVVGLVLLITSLHTVSATPQGIVAVGGTTREEDNTEESSCRDLDPQCEEFAASGECEGNPVYMEVACQDSCGTCIPQSNVKGCSDQREECPGWGQRGECNLNPAFMNVNCPLTCNSCPPAGPEDCVDQHEFCFLGSLLGLCRTNPSFYLIFCADSCRRFIPVCVQGRSSSTVPDLCFSRALGFEVECGIVPNTNRARRTRRNATENTTPANRNRRVTEHLPLHTNIHTSPSNISSQGEAAFGMHATNISSTNRVPVGETCSEMHKTISVTPVKVHAALAPADHVTGTETFLKTHRNSSVTHRSFTNNSLYTKSNTLDWNILAWWILVEGLGKGIKLGEMQLDLFLGSRGRDSDTDFDAVASRQEELDLIEICCFNETPTTTFPDQFETTKDFTGRRSSWENYGIWDEGGIGDGNVLEKLDRAWDYYDDDLNIYKEVWEEEDGVVMPGKSNNVGEDSKHMIKQQTSIEGSNGTVNYVQELADKKENQHNLVNKQFNEKKRMDKEIDIREEIYSERGLWEREGRAEELNLTTSSIPFPASHFDEIEARQEDICANVICPEPKPPESDLCNLQLGILNMTVNMCMVIPTTVISAGILIAGLLPLALPPPQLPPPPPPQFPPSQIPPQQPPPQSPPQSSPSPSPPSPPPSPSVPLLPLPLPEVRIRSLVPYCSGEGYLSLVERLQRLTTGNTGRPLNPIAASLTVAVNHCKYGVGTGDATVGSVPEAPPQLAFPTVTSILLRDREANISLQKPQRWPGLSMPALDLYLGGKQPPPPPSTTTTTTTSTTNATIITTVLLTNGTVFSNTSQVFVGVRPDIAVPSETPTFSDGALGGDGAPVDDGELGGEGVPDGNDTTGDGTPESPGESEGPKPVTEESLRSRESFACGGALISPYHVLTAAHCLIAPGISEDTTTRFQKPSVVRLGEVDFERVDESQAFDYKVAGVQVHEGYALPAKYNDIAIITLENRVEFTSALRPYCLPQRQDELVGRRCTVSGWGRRPGELASTVLHNVEVEVVSREECESAYLNDTVTRPIFEIDYPDGVTPVVLCAGKINNVCRGDSGGPLVLEEAGIQQEVGVVSTGYGCGSVLYPGLYTRIDQFTAWIEAEIYGAC